MSDYDNFTVAENTTFLYYNTTPERMWNPDNFTVAENTTFLNYSTTAERRWNPDNFTVAENTTFLNYNTTPARMWNLDNYTSTENTTFLNCNTTLEDCRTEVNIGTLVFLSVISPVTVTFSMVVNLLTILTISKQPQKHAAECIFLGLTIADLITVIGSCIYMIKTNVIFFSKILPYSIPEKTFSVLSSDIWLAVLYRYPISVGKVFMGVITIERYYAVSKPFEFRQVCTHKLGVTITVIVYGIMSVIYGLMILFDILFADPKFSSLIQSICTLGITSTTIGISVICNVMSCYKLIVSRKEIDALEQISKDQARMKRERRLTLVIFGISVLFVVCNIVPLILNVSILLYIDSWNADHSQLYWSALVTGTTISNTCFSCFNAIIFVTKQQKHKAIFKYYLQCQYCTYNI